MKRVIFNIIVLSLVGNLVEAEVQNKNTHVSRDLINPVNSTKNHLILPSAPLIPQKINSIPATPSQTGKESIQSSPARSGSRIPPAPPQPSIGTVPPPPPGMGIPLPPPSPGSVIRPAYASVDIQKIMENPRKLLEKLLEENESKLAANTVNLYLSGNVTEITEGINLGSIFSSKLSQNLNKDIEALSQTLEDLKANQKEDPILDLISDLILEPESDTTSDDRPLLKQLDEQLKLLSVKQYRGKNPFQAFKGVKNKIEEIARSYFERVNKSKDEIKSSSIVKTLEDVEFILEKSIILSNSFYNLITLLNEPREKAFTEYAVQDILHLINLKKAIVARIQKLEIEEAANEGKEPEQQSNVTNRFITFPIGDPIEEVELLKQVLSYFKNTFAGDDELDKIFKIRDLLNHKYTSINTVDKELPNTEIDPLSLIKILKDDLKGFGKLFEKIHSKAEDNKDNYSQFGPMFSLGDKLYGGALVKSINNLITSSNAEKFEENIEKDLVYNANQELNMDAVELVTIPDESYHTLNFNERSLRKAFNFKTPNKDFLDEYFSLLLVDGNLCSSFAQTAIKFIGQRTKFKVSFYGIQSKKLEQTRTQEQAQLAFKFLLKKYNTETKSNDYISLGTNEDPKKAMNLISLTQLPKNCIEYANYIDNSEQDQENTEEINKAGNLIYDLKNVSETINNLRIVNPEITVKQVDEYINKILDHYLVFDKNLNEAEYKSENGKIFLTALNPSDRGLISQSDIPNIVFALAKNCDVATYSSLPLLPTSSAGSKNEWVLTMSKKLSAAIGKFIDLFTDPDKQPKIESLITDSETEPATIEEVFENAVIELNKIKKPIDAAISRAEKKIKEKEQSKE